MSITAPSPLEERVARLEEQLDSLALPDNLQPSYLTVDSQGHIGADFTGHVKASGVDLSEAPPAPASLVQWLDAGGITRESINGVAVGGILHTLAIFAGGQSAVLLNGAGVSSFLQAQKNLSDLASVTEALGLLLGATVAVAGTGTLTWPGGGNAETNQLTVALAGASGTVHAIALPTEYAPGGLPFVVDQAFPNGTGGIIFTGRALVGVPAAGATAEFAYIMWGN